MASEAAQIAEPNAYADSASVLERAFGSLLRTKLFSHRQVNYAIHGLYALASENFDVQMPGMGQGFKMVAQSRSYMRVLKQFAKSIHAIDDRLDAMAPEAILAGGEAHLGTSPSEFLRNPAVFSPTEYACAKEMADRGFISKDAGIAFANLASVLVKEEAQQLLDYQRSHSIADRKKMLDTDRKITETLVGFIVHWFNRNPKIESAIASKDALAHEDIMAAYPKVTKLFRTLELKDDFLDIVPDLKQELETKRPVANWFLTRLEEKGQLFDAQGELQPYLKRFMADNEKRRGKIPLEALPEPLVMAVQEATDLFREVARAFPKVTRDALRADWDVTLGGGCYSLKALDEHNRQKI